MTNSRNQVIEAGAGTGKTYSLVQAILQALFLRRIPFANLVALTFTKKAAGEMKERVALELRTIKEAKTMPDAYRSWGSSLPDLQTLATEALQQIDRANISTIHSFAFTLLKRFPLEASINPESEVDEKGLRYAEVFDLEWPQWLSEELRERSPNEKDWLEILSTLTLTDVEHTARLLSDFEAPLRALPITDAHLPASLKVLVENLRTLLLNRPDKDKATRVAQVCEEVLGAASAGDWKAIEAFSQESKNLLRATVSATKGWPRSDLKLLRSYIRITQNVLARGDRLIYKLSERLKPFIVRFRSRVLSEGYLSNSALLALACELVKRDHSVRSRLKIEFRALFIDEFQDTDPLQGELLLFLSEKIEGHAPSWRDVKLEPGKLFVVGDPKQSIYRFRGADMAAYRQITEMILTQGGEVLPLQKSWRSHDQIIHVVNETFGSLIEEKPNLSPAYVPLVPARPREGQPLQNVQVRLQRSKEKQRSRDAALREAEIVARWIKDHVGKDICRQKSEAPRPLAYRDIALIFRSTPTMRPFVEALRRYNMPFVIEGERYFYSTPEVTDFINLLRVIENPQDRIGLVGFLRSPLGGLSDLEILQLREARALDTSRPLPATSSPMQRHLWDQIMNWRTLLGRQPLKVLLRHIFQDSFILELAARSYHRDQTVANLLKLKRLLESFAEDGVTTLRALLDKIRGFMEDDRLEGESPLADDTFDAIRILTIHKAKGLEFPVVILPSLHQGRDEKGKRRPSTALTYDWSSGRLGLRVAGYQNIEQLLLDQENELRDFEEEKRVFYVAMTRAREHLLLSGSLDLVRPSAESYLEWMGASWKLRWPEVTTPLLQVGSAEIMVTTVEDLPPEPQADPAPLGQYSLEALDPVALAAQWKERAQRQKSLVAKPLILRPSQIENHPESGSKETDAPENRPLGHHPLWVGDLVHRFLESWDFKRAKCEMPAHLRLIANRYFSALGLLGTPLKDPKEGANDFAEGELSTVLEPSVAEAQALLARFLDSPASQEIETGEILGREVPFVYRIDSQTLMRGTLDILYRSGGKLIVGDYKTGFETDPAAFAEQGRAYQEAVRRALGEKAEFRVLHLRLKYPSDIPQKKSTETSPLA